MYIFFLSFQAFLQLFADKYAGSTPGLDYPVTPGGMELDQSTDRKLFFFYSFFGHMRY